MTARVNYGLGHRYYARNFGAMSPPGFPSSLPGIGPLYSPAWGSGGGFNPTPKPLTIAPVATAAGAPAICLNQTQNSVPCADPSCTYGDCSSTAAQITVGALCLDQGENQIACTDPNCTYGDCVSASSWLTKSTIMTGIPDVAIYGGVLLLVMMLSGGGGYYAGRR